MNKLQNGLKFCNRNIKGNREMLIDSNTIKYIANLAMIELLPDEEEKYSAALEQILSYTEVLNNLDLSKADSAPLLPIAANRFREDEVKPPMSRDLLLGNSKDVESGMFCIPKVVD